MLNKGQKLIVIVGAWTLLLITVLTILGSLEYELFFMVELLGFMVICGLASPYFVRTGWVSRLNFLIFIGILAFTSIVIHKALVYLRIL